MASIRPKTIKDGFKSFFNRFLKRIELDENDDQYLQYRFIEFDKRRDVSFYSKLVIKAKREDYDGKKTFLVTCLRNTYFVTVGYRSVNIPTLVKPEDTPVGLFLAIVLEGDLQIKDNKDNLHIENEIIVPIEDTANPQGYDFDKIIEYFPEVNVYHVLFPSQDYNRLLDKLSIIMYCKNKSLLRLNIPENILLCYIDLIKQ